MTLPRTRDEHLAWCKERALAYLPSKPVEAMMSMASDLGKHPELAKHPGRLIMPAFYGAANDPEAVREWIVGFN
jgi:hypothetical protein